jgi:mono/diheme cytochrome c family protein
MMKTLIGWSRLLLVLTGIIFVAVLLAASVPVRATGDDDAAALYKAKCFACHGATAEKKFDATKADDALVDTILKGKKMEKPPNMPGFEEKGITADQAKALVAFMKSQKH